MAGTKTENSVELEASVEGGLSFEGGEINDVAGDAGSVEVNKATEETPAKPEAEEAEADKTAEEEGGEDDTSSPSTAEDLGEFKAEEAEKWTKTYTKEGGLLNTERLSSEWWANKKGEERGKLHEGTYKYLETKGFSRADVDAIGEALEGQAKQYQDQLNERAGGEEALNAALAWGRSGGYSKEQLDRFNKAMGSNRKDVMEDALDLLMVRYNKANPKTEPKAKPKEARGSAVPKKGGEVEKYKSLEEQIEAGHAVRKIKDPIRRKAAWDEHFAKMR